MLVSTALGVLVASRWTVPELELFSNTARAAPVATATAAPSPAPSDSPNDTLRAALAIVAPAKPPARLTVAAIGVDAVIEPVGLDAQGRMAAPSRADNVGWYRPGTVPGDAGNAVIDGHLDWTNGPAVFWRLGKLKVGDSITVLRQDGTQAKFIADATSVMPYDASTDALFIKSGPPSLTLITCTGSWDRQRETYLQRLVVHATLAPSMTPEKPG